MADPRHTLLLASAGTGKTHRLTSHLLGLLFRGADPARILPTTFTRKAAREILERVLQRLVEAVEDPAKCDDLAGAVKLELSAGRCRELLVQLAHRLDRFQVGTLDAFFVRLGHLFALDLGFPPGWSISDPLEEERQTLEAIGRVLAEGDREELLELLRGLQREGGARSLARALGGVVEDARPTFLESSPEAWDRIEPPPEVEPEEFALAVRNLRAFPTPTTAKGAPNKTWDKALARLRSAVDAGDWKGVLKDSLVKKVRAGEEQFSSVLIPPAFKAVLEPLLEQAAHGMLAEVARRNRAMVALLGRFERALQDVKRERASYGFLDLTLALAPGGPGAEGRLDERELDLQFRLDARIDHLLLDEFQDTSPVQWRILERLASEVLGEGDGERTFFCVGDVKQSIYGWREAEPRLLSEMHARHPGLEPESMTESYRSSAVVLDTVDRVFGRIHEASSLAKREPWLEAARTWRAGYARHVAAKPLPGAAVLLEARARDEDESKWEPVLELLVQRVEALVAEVPGASIGVLLRSNKPLPGILSRLLERGIRASGEGGNELTDSQAVLHLISLLHLVDHPGDRAAAFHVEQSPLAAALRDLDPGRAMSPGDLARRVRARLVRDGYGPFCAALAPAVERDENYGGWDRRRFRQLVDLAYAHDRRAGLRTDEFVEILRRTRVEDPEASQVKVMTIHASKGLEFDAVLLPELDARLHPRHPGVVGRRPDPTGGFEVASSHPGGSIVELDPLLTELDAVYQGRVIEESLSVLYVAMTRAARRLEMIVQRPTKKKDLGDAGAATYAAILREALGAGEPDEEGVLWRHPESAPDWGPVVENADEEGALAEIAEPPPDVPRGLGLATRRGLRSLVHRSPSAEEGGGTRVRGRVLLRRSDDALERGLLLHRWFEEVEWIEEFACSDEELLALAVGVEPDEERRRAGLAEFRAALARPAVRAALSRGPSGGGLFDATTRAVWRERRFSLVLPGEDGREVHWNGAIDRVVVDRDAEGSATGAEVLDFKTDRARGDELAGRVEFYRPQLEGYQRVVARITGLPERAVRATLLFVQPGRRVDL